MEKNIRKKIFVDMDDTLCDFSGAHKAATDKEPGIKWPQCQYDFFRTLKPLPGAVDTFKKLERYYDMYILTRPSVDNPMCFTEKAVWVRDNLGQEYMRKLIICSEKGLLGEKGNDILIDECIAHVQTIQKNASMGII